MLDGNKNVKDRDEGLLEIIYTSRGQMVSVKGQIENTLSFAGCISSVVTTQFHQLVSTQP
jgi:hypothetical protein